MISEQIRAGKTLVKMDVNSPIRPTEEMQRKRCSSWGRLGVKESEGERSNKPKILSEVAGFCSVQKKMAYE